MKITALEDQAFHSLPGCRGNPGLRDALGQASAPLLVVREHKPWPAPLVDLTPEVQVLNVHEQVYVLRAGRKPIAGGLEHTRNRRAARA